MKKNIKIKKGSYAETIYNHLKNYGKITKREATEQYGITNFHQVIDYLKNDLKLNIIKTRIGNYYEFSIGDKNEPDVRKSSITRIIIDHIKEHGSITKKEAFDLYGVINFSQRIAYIQTLGYKLYKTKDDTRYIKYSFEKPTENLDQENPLTWEEIVETRPEDMAVKNTLYNAVLNHLKKYRTIDSKEANELYGTLQLPAIIHKLRKDGYNISRSKTREVKFGNAKVDRNQSVYKYTLNKKKTERVVGYYIVKTYLPKYKSLLSDNIKGMFKTQKEAMDAVIKEMNGIYQTLISIIDANPNDAFLLDLEENGMIIKRRKFTGFFKRKMSITEEIKLTILEETEEIDE